MIAGPDAPPARAGTYSPFGIETIVLALALGRKPRGRGDEGTGACGGELFVQGVTKAARFVDGVDRVSSGDLLLDPGQELGPSPLVGGLDGVVVALDGGDDEVQIDVQAQLEEVALNGGGGSNWNIELGGRLC